MTALVWFRKALRVHDNAALAAAASEPGGVLPVFFLSERFLDPARFSSHRMQFLLEALRDLDGSLRRLNARSRLLVVRGDPEEQMPRLLRAWGVRVLLFERDSSPYARRRDAAVTRMAEEAGVRVKSYVGHTLWDLDKLARKCGADRDPHKLPQTMVAFERVVARMPEPPAPLPAPSSLPGLGVDVGADEHTVPASVTELGFAPIDAPTPFRGGETEALVRLQQYVVEQAAWVARFEKPQTDPTAHVAPGSKSTTVLSPYVNHGCLSVRRFFTEVRAIERPLGGKHSKPPGSLVGQLYFRELFYLAGYTVPNYDQIEGNPLCKQIRWEQNRPDLLEAWTNARTGYPWIDAAMTQLRTQGWMHHLARHAVACFLTRGDLYISWVDGAKVFNHLLLDGDWSVNTGNCCFFYQYMRVYSPVAFPRRYDKTGNYVREFLPILRKFPAEFIYEPWKAPLSVQQAAGCIIGKDYPLPIVDHDQARVTNIGRISAAYAEHKANAASRMPRAQPAHENADAEDEDDAAADGHNETNAQLAAGKRAAAPAPSAVHATKRRV